MTSIEREIVNFLYIAASSIQILKFIVIFFGHWSGYFIAPSFVIWTFWVWNKSGKLTFFIHAILAAVSSRIILEIIRFVWDIKRPFVELGIQPLFLPFEQGPSFPSGHATFYFALAAVSWNISKKASIAIFVAATLMGIGRISAAVHWPSDILAGAVLGVLAGFITRKIPFISRSNF